MGYPEAFGGAKCHKRAIPFLQIPAGVAVKTDCRSLPTVLIRNTKKVILLFVRNGQDKRIPNLDIILRASGFSGKAAARNPKLWRRYMSFTGMPWLFTVLACQHFHALPLTGLLGAAHCIDDCHCVSNELGLDFAL